MNLHNGELGRADKCLEAFSKSTRPRDPDPKKLKGSGVGRRNRLVEVSGDLQTDGVAL